MHGVRAAPEEARGGAVGRAEEHIKQGREEPDEQEVRAPCMSRERYPALGNPYPGMGRQGKALSRCAVLGARSRAFRAVFRGRARSTSTRSV